MKYIDLPHVTAAKEKATKNAPKLEYETQQSHGRTLYTIANCRTLALGKKILEAAGFIQMTNPNFYKKQGSGSLAQYAHWNKFKKVWYIEPAQVFTASQETN